MGFTGLSLLVITTVSAVDWYHAAATGANSTAAIACKILVLRPVASLPFLQSLSNSERKDQLFQITQIKLWTSRVLEALAGRQQET
jgi:accessory gene regulator protein AgrB